MLLIQYSTNNYDYDSDTDDNLTICHIEPRAAIAIEPRLCHDILVAHGVL